jgi:phage N-6-adenine-methyltransferase
VSGDERNPHERHGSATDVPGVILRGIGRYPITEKMRWRTPPWLYRVLDEEFHFDLDACAEDGCHLARRWITHEEDALEVDWRVKFRQRFGGDRDDYLSGEVQVVELEPEGHSPVRSAFLNPPWAALGLPKWVKEQDPTLSWSAFPGTGAFVARAWEMSRLGVTSAVLLPQAMDAAWFKPLVKKADEVRIGRRFKFQDCHGVDGPQPPGGHLLLVFRPHVPPAGWPGGPRVDWDWNPGGEP